MATVSIPYSGKPMPFILLLGDSLTQQGNLSNWVSRLSNHYIRRAEVVNRGLSGYNSRWVRDILQDDTRRQLLLPEYLARPLFVTIMLGSNDCSTRQQHVPLEEYKENLRSIIGAIRTHAPPTGGIVVLSPPPVDEESRARNMPIPAERSDRELSECRKYRDAALAVAKEEGVASADLFAAFLGDQVDAVYSKGPWCDYFYDGLHFNDAGGKVVFDQLMKTLAAAPLSAAVAVENIPYSLPPNEVLWV